jgi:uncharacterized membrane protein
LSKQNRERRLAIQRQQQMMMQVSRQYSFSGPLPPPEVLEKYNQSLPGAAERILSMAEQQSRHRQSLETKVIDANIFVQKVGPFLGFVIAMTAVVGGIVLILKGKDGYGLAAIVTALTSLAGVFIYGKSKQKKELDIKAEGFIPPPVPTPKPEQLAKV